MNKDFENKLHTMNDQDLTAVAGGTGETDRPSPYSVGQRVRVRLKTELGEMVLIGKITDITFIGTYTYSLTLDAPAPNGEINIFCFESHILGLASSALPWVAM